MDYHDKYLKYKKKYLELKLKSKMVGGNDEQLKEIASIKCETPNKILCKTNTKNLGLCVETKEDCNNLKIVGSLPNITVKEEHLATYTDAVERGRKKGYIDDYLDLSCYGIHEDDETNSIITFTHNQNDYQNILTTIPNQFNIITLNAMGIVRGDNSRRILMNKRIDMLVEQINRTNPDIICFQEMSIDFYDEFFPKLNSKYKFSNREIFEYFDISKRQDLSNFIVSKYLPIQTKTFKLKGNLGYPNCLNVCEFDNLIIFNCYLQAGSSNSLGQQYKWKHYSRCRIHQLEYIKDIISQSSKPFVILGDFNFDVNDIRGTIFPEAKYLNNLILEIGAYDSFKTANPSNPGYTEDTDANSLRWNDKFETKKYRYDAIFASENLQVLESQLFANEPTILETTELNNAYEKLYVKDPNDSRLKTVMFNGEKVYELFISDHFGVLSKFKFE